MITEQQYEEAVSKCDEYEKIIHAYNKQSIENFDARWKRFNKNNEFFRDEDLVYSAYTQCKKCGAGLAYPKDCDAHHQWTCSNVLKGIGTDKGHDAFSFIFYKIKSEQQPSAQGLTTRPNKNE
ncbi:MAG: hypothetical protein Q7R95_06190 [bacterium]|nr:hypothetical protein [bacterium]